MEIVEYTNIIEAFFKGETIQYRPNSDYSWGVINSLRELVHYEKRAYQFRVKPPTPLRKIGQKYRYNDTESIYYGRMYILAQPTARGVCLIDLQSGNRYTDPVAVVSPLEISEKEWDEMTDGVEFILIEED